MHRAIDQAAHLIDTVIAPAMTAVDASAVPRSHLEALAGIGVLGASIADSAGRLPVPPAVAAEIVDLLSGACPSTFLIASQHTTPATWIAASATANLPHLLDALATGQRIGGAAFGHIRTWPRRASVTAVRAPGGWRFTGEAPWFSGDGVSDLVAVAAIDERARRIVFAVIDLPSPAVSSAQLPLAAIGGSRTSTLAFDGAFVPDTRVTDVAAFDDWIARDGRTGPRILPGALGLARSALIDALAKYPADPGLNALADEVAAIRAAAAGADDRPVGYWRARAVNLAVRAAQAAIVARGGAALLLDDPAQVRARAAAFLQVRGVNDALRAEHFAALAASDVRPSRP